MRLAELLPKPANGEALRFLDFSAPITDPSGRVFRVFASHVGWDWASALRKDVFGPAGRSSGIEAVLVDTESKVVLAAADRLKVGSSLQSVVDASITAPTTVTWPDGGDYLTAVSGTSPHGAFPGFGWKVVTRQPAAAASAAAGSLRLAFGTGALLLGTLGALGAWYLAGRLVRPVRLLVDVAARAQAGDALTAERVDGSDLSVVREAIVTLADTARLEREASLASRRQFAALADSLPQIVFRADASGLIEYVNRHLPGGGPAVTPGQAATDLSRLVQEEDRAAFAADLARSVETGADLRARCRMRLGERSARWFDVEMRAIRNDDGAVTQWVGTFFDVHDVVARAEVAQQALSQERQARVQAEHLARLRDQFLATVSHELRSPLSVIAGWSDILKRKGTNDPMVAKAAAAIRTNARLQAELINDLMDVTAVAAGKLSLSEELLDLSQLAAESALLHRKRLVTPS